MNSTVAVLIVCFHLENAEKEGVRKTGSMVCKPRNEFEHYERKGINNGSDFIEIHMNWLIFFLKENKFSLYLSF